MNRCIAYGDCNTEGLKGCDDPLWPELVAEALGFSLTNCGHTMSTTRELLRYAEHYPPGNFDTALVQFGLVDSWLTFRGAPYVLYYPDNPARKWLRKLVKKLKKWARSLRLQHYMGAVEQVPPEEYQANIRQTVNSAPETRFVLVATAPNLDESRNPRIRQYNELLRELAGQQPNTIFVDTYEQLWVERQRCLMTDGTHLSADGHRLVADAVIAALKSS